MSASEDWSRGPVRPDATASGLISRPRIGLVDVLLQLWRSIWLMLLVFLPIFLAGLWVAFSMKEEFTARSRLLVSLGDEYIFRPSVGPESNPVSPDMDALIQSELEMLRSPVVASEALSRFDLERVFPKLLAACYHEFEDIVGTEQFDFSCRQLAVQQLNQSFSAAAAPEIPVLTSTFTHEEPEVAAEVLNAIIGAYLNYRSSVFADSNSSGLAQQRDRFEASLKQADDQIRQFLVDNGIGNFDSERDTIKQLYQSASGELLSVESRMRLVDGQLKTYEQQILSIAPEQDMYVDDTSQQTLADLRLEREQKLTRYTADSRVIQEIDKRIAEVESYFASRDGLQGTVRRGPNPLYQQIETSIKTLQAEAASLRDQQAELKRQIAGFETRQQRLTDLEPRYQELIRGRDILEQNVRSFAEREMEARARSELVQQSFNNIRVLEPAIPPVKGHSLKLPVAILSLLVAGFTALMAGLARALTQTRFSTGRSIERTLGIPVIAQVRPV
ncbi:MAG: Wzz/FepE/Etk N-terminal domain-containing protein [Hyphomonas sp.]|uniref:GumC family protein n=1 Tax=Hyphomonas sp. TaxID=87 RepID=UPI0035274B50